MNPPPVQDAVAAVEPLPRPHQPETSPFPRLAESRRPPNEPPSSRIGSGLFRDPEQPARVEILLRTGLRGETNGWERAFAHDQAQTHGPTALVRMKTGAMRIELHARVESIPTLPESIRERADWAIAWVSWFARSTVVAPISDGHPGPFLDWDVPIHLLTEVGKQQIVDTYECVKRIHVNCRRHAFDVPPLDLVIVNTPDPIAQIGGNSLQQTSRTFLDHDLPTTCIIERMPRIDATVQLDFDLQPGFGCDQVLEILECRQRDRRHGRRGDPFP